VARVTVVTESEISFIGSTSFQNLPGANTTITVPAGTVQLVRAEFSADAAVTLSGMSFFLDDWSLTITQYNNGK